MKTHFLFLIKYNMNLKFSVARNDYGTFPEIHLYSFIYIFHLSLQPTLASTI